MNQMKITSVLYSPVFVSHPFFINTTNKLIIIMYLELSDYPRGHINSVVQYPLIDDVVFNQYSV